MPNLPPIPNQNQMLYEQLDIINDRIDIGEDIELGVNLGHGLYLIPLKLKYMKDQNNYQHLQ